MVVKIIVSVFLTLSAGFIGSVFTTPYIPTWYANLNKPFFNPPNWLFGPVWSFLFVLMGISLSLIWQTGIQKKGFIPAIIIFSVQLLLNILWSFFFFKSQNPALAFGEILLLWVSIILTIVSFWPLNRLASILLFPYLGWVSFASVLNYFIWRLNP